MYEFPLPNLFGVCNLYVIKSLGLCEWQIRRRLAVGEMSLSVFQLGYHVSL